ncbi:MAG: DUF2332 domain-containing protein [Actinobacteria bacterium]|nr:DUF2332 domain-containing protein [Actinomycetota bacterium]
MAEGHGGGRVEGPTRFDRFDRLDHRTGGDRRRMFADFAAGYPDLPLYSRLASAIAGDGEIADLLGAAAPGQDRPVLLFAAVHELVLRRPDLPLARWYSSLAGSPAPAGDPWPEFRATCLDHRDELCSTIASRTTQTNEVNRCVLLAPLIAQACADRPGTPLALLELGTSAGLLLGIDRYAVEVGDAVVGDRASPVRCAGSVLGTRLPPTAPFPPAPPVAARAGLDVAPVSLDDAGELRWLEACLWPDQPARLTRFRAAVELARADPPHLVRGDMVDDLPATLAALPGGTHLVVFHCWALTYVSRERRAGVAGALAAAAGGGRPVSWLTAEPPGCAPGIEMGHTAADTILGLRRWRDGAEQPPLVAGTAHPHGAWIRWGS